MYVCMYNVSAHLVLVLWDFVFLNLWEGRLLWLCWSQVHFELSQLRKAEVSKAIHVIVRVLRTAGSLCSIRTPKTAKYNANETSLKHL